MAEAKSSSKGASDALEWFAKQAGFPPLLILRRYLKLAIEFSIANEIMDVLLADAPAESCAIPVR